MKIFPHELVGIFGRLFWGILLDKTQIIARPEGRVRLRELLDANKSLNESADSHIFRFPSSAFDEVKTSTSARRARWAS